MLRTVRVSVLIKSLTLRAFITLCGVYQVHVVYTYCRSKIHVLRWQSQESFPSNPRSLRPPEIVSDYVISATASHTEVP